MPLKTAAAMAMAATSIAVGAASSALAFTVTETPSLGAASGAAISCDTDGVHLGTWTTANDAAGAVLTGAVLDGVAAACNGKTVDVSFTAADGTSLGSAQFTVAGDATAFTFAAVPVAQLHSTAVTISG